MPALRHLGYSLPVFPDTCDGNVTFVIGTLDNDPVKFNLLKEYVAKALFHLSSSCPAFSFNVIHFSEEVTKWCDLPVTSTPETIVHAVSWLQTLQCETGNNPTDALDAAFEDPACQMVYMVTDCLPGSVLQDFYSLIASHKDTRSVNVVYLVSEPCDSQVEGSFKMICLQPSGLSEVRMPLVSHYRSPKEIPVAFQANEDPVSTEALYLLRGVRVLARRETDGYYYLGHIAREVEGSHDQLLVEFEKCRSLKGRAQFRMQQTPVCDIIHYEDARWKPLAPGDHVLAPLESNMQQYGPGTVLQGSESRQRDLAFDSGGILVTFWNGKTKSIPPGLAVWIPQQLSDRITLELLMPLEARKKLVESFCGYSFKAPLEYKGSRSQSQEDLKSTCASGSQSCLYCNPSRGLCRRCHVPEEQWAAIRASLSHLSRMTRDKPTRRTEKDQNLQQEKRPELLYRRDTKTNHKYKRMKEPRRTRHVERLRPVPPKEPVIIDTDIERKSLRRTQSSSVKSHLKNTTEGSAIGNTAKSSSKSSSPSLNNMTRLQATLRCIDKAMREDQLALEAAVRERRPRTAPLIQSYDLQAKRSQELNEKKGAVRLDLRRFQVEQRQRRTEEKIRDMEQREQMLEESRRLRSEQRIQLDLERKQDQEGIEAQQVESRKVASQERNKKQEEALERERRTEAQRVQFLTDNRREREETVQEQSRKSIEREERHKKQIQNRTEMQRRKQEADIQEWHKHQELQDGARRKASRRLEQFYRKVEEESQKDKDLQQYLKEHNLQALRSAMVL